MLRGRRFSSDSVGLGNGVPIIEAMSYRSYRHLVKVVVLLLTPISVPAELPETLPCAPDCRGANLAGATLTNLNLNRG